MSKKPVVHYRVAVAVAAILSMALAEYIQRGPFLFPPALLAPIMIPLVCSYTCSAWSDSPFLWRFVFAGVSITLYLILFLPVLFRRKFKTRIAFLCVQAAVVIAFVWISLPWFKRFASWMSV